VNSVQEANRMSHLGLLVVTSSISLQQLFLLSTNSLWL